MTRLISWLIVLCLIGVWIPATKALSTSIIAICFAGWIVWVACSAIGLTVQGLTGTRYDQILNAQYDEMMIKEIESRHAGS